MTDFQTHLCAACAAGHFEECENPLPVDGDPDWVIPCFQQFGTLTVIEGPKEKGAVGRPLLAPAAITDVKSTGRKRAAAIMPFLHGQVCGWAGLKHAGGGVIPILGCQGNTIADVKTTEEARERGADEVGHRHHGPDKNVLNNTPQVNLHGICTVCVTGETRILTEDLRWVDAEDIQAGDSLWGFDEDLSEMRLKPTKVLSVSRVVEPSYRLHMSNGDVLTSSHAHQWVAARPSDGHHKWYRTEQFLNKYETPRKGRFSMRKFLTPWDFPDDYQTGWLAGFLDGEGHLGQTHLSASQTISGGNEIPAEKMASAFERYAKGQVNYTWRDGHPKNKDALVVRITSLALIMQTLGTVRPSRLMAKATDFITGKRALKRPTETVYVDRVEYIGEIEVYAIETSTGTYIAEGYLSHNCHTRWHALNDPHYDPEGRPDQADRPFLPVEAYYFHDQQTAFTDEEYLLAEEWWDLDKKARGPYPFSPPETARRALPLVQDPATLNESDNPFADDNPFSEIGDSA